MAVFITDGDQRSALATARSLGRQGIKVTVGEKRKGSLASSSRYCSREFVYPSPVKNPVEFQEEIIGHIKSNSYDVIIPMTDITCYLINDIRDKLSDYVNIALPDKESFENASDKASLMRMAESLNVPIPKTWFVDEKGKLDDIAKQVEYPVVIKPSRSRLLTPDGWINGTVEYAYSPEELEEKYNSIHQNIPDPIIQERIEGPGHGVFLLYSNGQRKAFFGHRRIREKPPSGGVSVLRESILPDSKTLEHSCTLLEAFKWNGAAMVEFKIDSRDNTPKLMEINGRLWGSLQLAIDAGVDFPFLLYQTALGREPQCVESFKEGIKTRWLLGDLDHLMIILLHKRRKLALPKDFPGRFGTFAGFIKSFFDNNTRQEIWRNDDTKPAFNELKDYFQSGFVSLKERLF